MQFRRAAAVAVGLVLTMGALWACTDYDDAPSAEDAGAGADATNDGATGNSDAIGTPTDDGATKDAEPADAASDAPPDGDVPVVDSGDGGTDAQSPANPCGAGGYLFCWNFNGTDPPPLYGAQDRFATNGSLAVEAAAGANGKALHAAVTSNGRAALLWKISSATPAADGIQLRSRFKVAKASGFAVVTAIEISPGAADYGLAVTTTGCIGLATPCIVAESAGSPIAGSIPVDNSWHDAVIAVKKAGTTWSGSVRVDDKVLSTSGNIFAGGTTAGAPTILAGAFYAGTQGSGGSEVFVDDLLLQKSP